MKKFLAVVVMLGICALYATGCQKKAGETGAEGKAPVKMEQAVTPPPPPPPQQ